MELGLVCDKCIIGPFLSCMHDDAAEQRHQRLDFQVFSLADNDLSGRPPHTALHLFPTGAHNNTNGHHSRKPVIS